jgi:hypothetical protein
MDTPREDSGRRRMRLRFPRPSRCHFQVYMLYIIDSVPAKEGVERLCQSPEGSRHLAVHHPPVSTLQHEVHSLRSFPKLKMAVLCHELDVQHTRFVLLTCSSANCFRSCSTSVPSASAPPFTGASVPSIVLQISNKTQDQLISLSTAPALASLKTLETPDRAMQTCSS